MPKIVDHNLYRQELLSKCFDLFAEKGYGSITMRQISQGLGVSTGTLYHYFPSKKELFIQLIQEVVEKDILNATAETEGTTTLKDRAMALGKYLHKYQDYHIKWTYLLVDFYQHQDAEGVSDSSVIKMVCERYQQEIYRFLGFEDKTIANFILCLIDGLILEKLMKNEEIDLVEQCTLLGKMLVAYFEKYPEGLRRSLEI
jgi:AcrR family transcriptional regulator